MKILDMDWMRQHKTAVMNAVMSYCIITDSLALLQHTV